MSKTAEQRIADLIYRDLAGGSDSEQGLINALEPFFASHLGLKLDRKEFSMLIQRVQNHPEYDQQNSALIEKWRGSFEQNDTPASPSEATSFIHDLLACHFRELLFAHTIIAGTTNTEAGGLFDTITLHNHHMPSWTLHRYTQGMAQIYSKTHITDIVAGDLVLLKPDADCHYQRHPDCDLWIHQWVLFQPRQHWLEWMAWPEIDDGIYRLQPGNGEATDSIAAAMQEVVSIGAGGSGLKHDLQMNLLEQVIIRAGELIPQQPEQSLDPRIHQACDYIRDHLAQAFSVDDVAAHCNLSPSHLSHLFKHQIGLSPKRWRDDLRLLEARKLLLERQRSIASIAEQIGYSDQMQFSRLFRKKMGCSPSQFRNL